MSTPSTKAILGIGLPPNVRGVPITVTNIMAAVQTQWAELEQRGFEKEMLFVNADDETSSLNKINDVLKSRKWDGIIIGGGLRVAPELNVFFEKIIQACARETKGEARLVFPSRPDDIVESVRRNFPENFA